MRKELQIITKKICMCLLLLCITVSAGGCGELKQEKRPQNELTEITMVLDWTPDTTHTGLYVALKKGYFEKQGLDVTLVEPPEDGATNMVAAGEAEFGIGFQDDLAENFSSNAQLPVTAVAALLQHNQTGFISLKMHEIDTPAKIAGHSMATSDETVEQAMVRDLVEAAGGDYFQIQMESTYVDDVAETLDAGIHVVLGDYGWDSILCERRGLQINYLPLREQNEIFDYYSPVIIANNTFLTEEPDMAKAFLKAVREGYQDAVLDPAEAAGILLEEVSDLDKGLVESSQRYMSQQYIADSEAFGVIDPERWNRFYNWINEKKLFQNEIPEGTGFTNEFLEE